MGVLKIWHTSLIKVEHVAKITCTLEILNYLIKSSLLSSSMNDSRLLSMRAEHDWAITQSDSRITEIITNRWGVEWPALNLISHWLSDELRNSLIGFSKIRHDYKIHDHMLNLRFAFRFLSLWAVQIHFLNSTLEIKNYLPLLTFEKIVVHIWPPGCTRCLATFIMGKCINFVELL